MSDRRNNDEFLQYGNLPMGWGCLSMAFLLFVLVIAALILLYTWSR